VVEDDGSPDWEDEKAVVIYPLKSNLSKAFGVSKRTSVKIAKIVSNKHLDRQRATLRLISVLLDHFEHLEKKKNSLRVTASKNKLKHALYRRLNPRPVKQEKEEEVVEEVEEVEEIIQGRQNQNDVHNHPVKRELSLSRLHNLISIKPEISNS